ncbi:NAD(P)-binding protein [Trichoderma ceciliae]
MAAKRTVLISGCSDGSLGSELALAFHRNGWRVFASARNLAKLKQAEAAGLEIVRLDTTSDESIAACVAQVADLTGGSLDALVNNAGAGYSMPVMDLDIAQTRQLFELNVFSLITVTRAFFPLLLKSSGGGLVVNNTSCMALPHASMPFSGAYNASKAAAANFSEVLRLELAPFGIKVTNLVTGSVKSTFHANAPHTSLPPDSIYNVAKEAVEKWMSGAEATATGADPVEWAEGVVKDLSKTNPPLWVWRGKHATAARIASFFPTGALDSTYKSRTGLDEVSRKLNEQGGLDSINRKP